VYKIHNIKYNRTQLINIQSFRPMYTQLHRALNFLLIWKEYAWTRISLRQDGQTDCQLQSDLKTILKYNSKYSAHLGDQKQGIRTVYSSIETSRRFLCIKNIHSLLVLAGFVAKLFTLFCL
jgi:hypothetical protein